MNTMKMNEVYRVLYFAYFKVFIVFIYIFVGTIY